MTSAMAFVAAFAQRCPAADPADVAAFSVCRAGIARSLQTGAAFAPFIMWGGDVAGKTLDNLQLTRFDAGLFSELYLSLFSAVGRPDIHHDPERGLNVIDVPARFRNGLAAGEYPYPFWHAPAKWDAYQDSNLLRFYLRPEDGRIATVLRSDRGIAPTTAAPRIGARPFDGKWMWEEDGQLQPRVTLFADRFRTTNPYLSEVERTYRLFADVLRQGTCLSCHVPNNPNGMKRLVLLQTPAHAAGAIRRVLAKVASGEMPVEEWGDPRPIDPATKRALVEEGAAFADALDKAKAWETEHP